VWLAAAGSFVLKGANMANEQEDVLYRRRITLPDGRYLIFYTVGDEDAAHAAERTPVPERAQATQPANPKPQAEEERHV
jgi:hypothetical protein